MDEVDTRSTAKFSCGAAVNIASAPPHSTQVSEQKAKIEVIHLVSTSRKINPWKTLCCLNVHQRFTVIDLCM